MATPHTTGVAALAKQAHPDRTSQELALPYLLVPRAISKVSVDQTNLDFVINSSSRFFNPTNVNFAISIDNDLDGTNDYLGFTADAGTIRGEAPVGHLEIFIHDLKTSITSAAGFLPVAPGDSSSVMMEIKAADVGVNGKLAYCAEVRNVGNPTATDVVEGKARYDPKNKAFVDGQLLWLAPNNGATIFWVETSWLVPGLAPTMGRPLI